MFSLVSQVGFVTEVPVLVFVKVKILRTVQNAYYVNEGQNTWGLIGVVLFLCVGIIWGGHIQEGVSPLVPSTISVSLRLRTACGSRLTSTNTVED